MLVPLLRLEIIFLADLWVYMFLFVQVLLASTHGVLPVYTMNHEDLCRPG